MNALWPAASRISCLNTRTILHACREFDCLAARLTQRPIRQYSNSCISVRPRESALWRNGASERIPEASKAPSIQIFRRGFASERRLIVITKFEDLPKSYHDQRGLAYRDAPLTKEETRAIFGDIITPKEADKMLRIMHGRRVAGTLDDPVLAHNPFEERAQVIGLEWLREHILVDEVWCAGMRAEQELAEMQADVIADAERIGIYKPNSGYARKDIYGKSAFDKIRAKKEAELDEKERLEKEQQKAQVAKAGGKSGTLETISPRSKVVLRTPGQHPKLKYYLERAKVLPDAPPVMTAFERLWPSALIILGVILGSYLFTQVYIPPKNKSRMFPDVPPSAATIIGIISVNAVVLLAWRVPPMFRFLNTYFMVVPGYPRAASHIGALFSHQTLAHFAANMAVLWFVGIRLHEEIGRSKFLAVYLSTGVVGSFVSMASFVLRKSLISSSLGASGAVCGVIATYLILNSSQKVTFFGVFPPENWPSISAMALMGLLLVAEVVGMRKGIVQIDHYAHFGGYGSGIVAALLLKRSAAQKKKAEEERRKNLSMLDRIKEGRF